MDKSENPKNKWIINNKSLKKLNSSYQLLEESISLMR